ncbi:MAG TPA: bifunctional DNA-formamidopyrimidine glycosylase/DNA-(apurinic or apyrimidinic site) lyase [Ilumatobacteraceae bacterium]|nr:bifunctional DNA-formamidopyrimidine glycosylase/DNA-(apurinic or apyrimidinic site) lyase [Ilumatobacteraceae bacterium]
MPELPEVETVRRGMVGFVVGRRIERVEVGRERTVRRTSRQALIDGLTGATITTIGRRGKYIVCSLDTGDALMIHLRMSGRVLVSKAGAPRPNHTHVVLHLAGDPPEELWFIDPRTFGEMVVFDPERTATEVPELARMGVDPIADGLSVAELNAILRGRARQLKPLLLDQHVIAGIGNIYCDEILHRARLRPDRLANSLKPADVRRLHAAIHSILESAIEAGGSTLSDTQYVDVMGDGGSFQLDHRVYDRAGQRCLTCGQATIVRIVSGGRSTCFCPRCQR